MTDAPSIDLPGLEPGDLTLLQAHAELRSLPDRAVLIEQGSTEHTVVLLLEGHLRAERVAEGSVEGGGESGESGESGDSGDSGDEGGGEGLTLAILGPGELVGELSWLEQTPAAARVVADGAVRVAVLPEGVLEELLDAHPGLSRRWYRALALLLSKRLRALSRWFAQRDGAATAARRRSSGNLTERHLPTKLRDGVRAFEAAVREVEDAPSDAPDLQARIADACEALLTTLGEISQPLELLDIGARDLLAFRAPEDLEEGLGALAFRETFPVLMRSATLSAAQACPPGRPADRLLLQQVLATEPAGDGRTGLLVDRWALDRPWFAAMRRAPDALRELLPDGPLDRVLLVEDAVGHGLIAVADRRPQHLTALDADPEALASLGARAEGLGLPRPVLLYHSVMEAVRGRARLHLVSQDLVYAARLGEFATDEDLLETLAWIHGALRPGGCLLLASLPPGHADAVLLDHLLGWRMQWRDAAEWRLLADESPFAGGEVVVREGPHGRCTVRLRRPA